MTTGEKVLIGTSGWGYDEWIGPFYPRGMKKEAYLSYYSNIFYTNEINTTFYNIPSRVVVEGWVKRTPANFLFSAKVPKSVTHDKKLDCNECLDDLDRYLSAMSPLMEAGKLLAFLIQLPPSFTKDEHFGNLQEFISNWPQEWKNEGYHLVVEFRHKSWMVDEVFQYLKDSSLTYCAVIEPLLPPRMDVTNADFVYIRFHGYGKKPWFNYCFTDDEIKEWARSVRVPIEQAKRVGIYFNNHFSGYATKNSLMMMQELGMSPRNEPKEISLLDVQKQSGAMAKGQTSIDKFLKS